MYISASADKREKSKEREIVSVFIMFCIREDDRFLIILPIWTYI